MRHISNEESRARAPSILRSTCQYSFGQAFTRDQVIAFAESLVEDTDVEVGLLNGKSMTHIDVRKD
jgi:hypothetical protein